MSYPPGVSQWHVDYYAGGYDEPREEEEEPPMTGAFDDGWRVTPTPDTDPVTKNLVLRVASQAVWEEIDQLRAEIDWLWSRIAELELNSVVPRPRDDPNPSGTKT